MDRISTDVLRSLHRQLRYLAGYFETGRNGVVPRLTDFGRCARPVLLLHGFFATRRVLDVLERRLRHDGWCVFSLNLGGLARTFNTRGIHELGEYVHLKVERLYERNPALGPLSIVGHSMGGLIGAHYVKALGGAERAARLVTLGMPYHGTPVAYAGIPFGFVARSVWQMVPTSPFLQRLRSFPWPAGVRVASLYSRADGVARYPSPLIEADGARGLRNVEVQARGHREFLYSRCVYRAIAAELRADASVTLHAPATDSTTAPLRDRVPDARAMG